MVNIWNISGGIVFEMMTARKLPPGCKLNTETCYLNKSAL